MNLWAPWLYHKSPRKLPKSWERLGRKRQLPWTLSHHFNLQKLFSSTLLLILQSKILQNNISFENHEIKNRACNSSNFRIIDTFTECILRCSCHLTSFLVTLMKGKILSTWQSISNHTVYSKISINRCLRGIHETTQRIDQLGRSSNPSCCA